MMLVAENISKFFGPRKALDDVSFAVGRGEIVGFLGGNGAGKSTTMRILTGFTGPTLGRALVAGRDPRRAETRTRIGYLPEDNPLPARMRVREYLAFRAALKGLRGKAAAAAIRENAGECGLEQNMTRLLGHLSKGTRQRVGLADAMLGRPEVLILDEPTAGLDPSQAAETRALVARLGRGGDGDGKTGATVLLSSHILSDIEAICGRVLILNRGRLAADAALSAIHEKYVEERALRMEVVAGEPVEDAFRAVPGVRAVTRLSRDAAGAALRLAVPAGADPRRGLASLCAERGWLVTEMRLEPVTLENIFRKLTGTEPAEEAR